MTYKGGIKTGSHLWGVSVPQGAVLSKGETP